MRRSGCVEGSMWRGMCLAGVWRAPCGGVCVERVCGGPHVEGYVLRGCQSDSRCVERYVLRYVLRYMLRGCQSDSRWQPIQWMVDCWGRLITMRLSNSRSDDQKLTTTNTMVDHWGR